MVEMVEVLHGFWVKAGARAGALAPLPRLRPSRCMISHAVRTRWLVKALQQRGADLYENLMKIQPALKLNDTTVVWT
jgi:hypothetical protein